jgi:hypothetical protein
MVFFKHVQELGAEIKEEIKILFPKRRNRGLIRPEFSCFGITDDAQQGLCADVQQVIYDNVLNNILTKK